MNMPVFGREGLFLPNFLEATMRLTFATRFVLAREIHKLLASSRRGPEISRLYNRSLIGEVIHDLGGLAGEW